jgi:hypothetical protein
MAAIPFNTAHQNEQVRKQIETALAAYREMLDTFVSNRMRQAAAEAEQVHPRQPLVKQSQPTKRPMIAMQLMRPDVSRRAPSHLTAAVKREWARAGSPPADATAKVIAQFLRLDPGIVNEAIPAFFIGRNKEGFWVARDANGQIGGIFLLEKSAVSFARKNSRPAGCATIFPSERIELDLENKGNPLVAQLASLIRLARRPQQRLAALIGK